MSLSRIRTGVVAALVVTAAAVATTQTASANPVPAKRVAKNHVVKMITTEDKKQLFEPANLTIAQGDTVTWEAVSGSHNVGFWADSIPKGAEAVLVKAMPDTISHLLGERKPTKGDTYVIVFKDAPKGTYKYFCKPHLTKMMVGTLTVK